MNSKKAIIGRKNGKPHIDVIVVERQHDSVEWSIGEKENTEFKVLFKPKADPLKPGRDTSTNHILQREIGDGIPRGNNLKYEYKIKLIRTDEDVECKSPPEMEIQ